MNWSLRKRVKTLDDGVSSCPRQCVCTRPAAPRFKHVQIGDRVAYAGGPPGSYAEVRVMPADPLLKVPEGIADKDVVLSGKVKIEINHTFALRDAQQVHRDLESRKTTGSIVMVP
jgi:NADPH:quinone reductase-like Zn-dependent oxidoreductase